MIILCCRGLSCREELTERMMLSDRSGTVDREERESNRLFCIADSWKSLQPVHVRRYRKAATALP